MSLSTLLLHVIFGAASGTQLFLECIMLGLVDLSSSVFFNGKLPIFTASRRIGTQGITLLHMQLHCGLKHAVVFVLPGRHKVQCVELIGILRNGNGI